MNNKEFSKLLKEWKQKNEQEDLEENFLKKAAAGVALATGLGMANPAAAEPAEKPAATQQVQLDDLSLAAVGYLEAYTRVKKADTPKEVYEAMEAIQNQKEVKDQKVSNVINLAKQKMTKAQKEDNESFENYKKMGQGVKSVQSYSFGK